MKTKLLLISVMCLFVLTVAAQNKHVSTNVMSFNIRFDNPGDSANTWKYRADNVAMLINYYAPDLLGLQEVMINQMGDLKKRLPQYATIGVARVDGKEKGEFNPIFFNTSRYKLLKHGDFSLSESPDKFGIRGWDSAFERIVTWAILKDRSNGKKVAVFNTHFDHVGQVSRRESAKLLLAKVKEIADTLPLVITGDFNFTPDSEPFKILTESTLKATCLSSPIIYGPSGSFHDFGRIPEKSRSLIDFIFVNEHIQTKKYRVIADQPKDGYFSDHNPILITY